MHSAFLYHAIRAGMDMGIVNAGQLGDLRRNSRRPARARRRRAAQSPPRRHRAPARIRADGGEARRRPACAQDAWRSGTVEERLSHALVQGITEFIDADIEEARLKYDKPAAHHRRPADGRHERRGRSVRLGKDVSAAGGQERAGDEAGRGRSCCRIWKREKLAQGGRQAEARILMATVKGDVHDIGKNIVGVVLGCNNYEVIDLGVMVPAEKILEVAREKNVDLIGLSGLITPSLDEMVHVARRNGARGFPRAAADRRRHHQPRAHRRQDRPGLSSAGSACARRLARRGRGRQPAKVPSSAPPSPRKIAASSSTPREQHQRPAASRRCSRSKKRAAAARCSIGAPTRRPCHRSPACAFGSACRSMRWCR